MYFHCEQFAGKLVGVASAACRECFVIERSFTSYFNYCIKLPKLSVLATFVFLSSPGFR